jgi:hypothetical protein
MQERKLPLNRRDAPEVEQNPSNLFSTPVIALFEVRVLQAPSQGGWIDSALFKKKRHINHLFERVEETRFTLRTSAQNMHKQIQVALF